MSITFTHRYGGVSAGSEEGILDLIAELEGPYDDEHPDVAITDDGMSWCLSAYQDGGIILENLDDSNIEPRNMRNVPRTRLAEIMSILARGEIQALQELDWQAGYY